MRAVFTTCHGRPCHRSPGRRATSSRMTKSAASWKSQRQSAVMGYPQHTHDQPQIGEQPQDGQKPLKKTTLRTEGQCGFQAAVNRGSKTLVFDHLPDRSPWFCCETHYYAINSAIFDGIVAGRAYVGVTATRNGRFNYLTLNRMCV